jgi:hypothetical protein
VTDYKKYALGQVENFLYDAMSTDATPQEIYDVIKGVVEDNYYTYKKCASEAYELLGLLNGNGKGHINLDQEHSEHYYDYDRNKPVAKTCDKDDTSEECKKSWSDFWEEHYYPEEHQQYTDEEIDEMCAAAEAKDQVKKWVLPVEETKDADTDEIEYFITFPDDLLEAANLKEGDTVNWIDNGDGSFKMIKVTKPLGMEEC